MLVCVYTGKSYKRGRLSTFDLLLLTSFDQLHFMLKILLTFLQSKLFMRRSSVLSLPPQLEFPGLYFMKLSVGTNAGI